MNRHFPILNVGIESVLDVEIYLNVRATEDSHMKKTMNRHFPILMWEYKVWRARWRAPGGTNNRQSLCQQKVIGRDSLSIGCNLQRLNFPPQYKSSRAAVDPPSK